MTETAPYGTWRSPVTLDALVRGAMVVTYPTAAGESLYWLERRPEEGGRQVIVRSRPDGSQPSDCFGPDYNARTLVHEYGGLPYCASGETVFFSNFADQRLYKVKPGGTPVPLTAEPESPRAVRFAAPVCSPDGLYLYAVRERHQVPDDLPTLVQNEIVAIATDGSREHVVASGRDFYSHVTLSPDSRRLAYVAWDHPHMPWDETELFELDLEDGLPAGEGRRIAGGGKPESITQPKYSPSGVLHFISDRTNWWNLYRVSGDGGAAEALVSSDHDLGVPDWVFGRSTYAFLQDGSVVISWHDKGIQLLGVTDPVPEKVEPIETGYTDFDYLTAEPSGHSVIAVASGPASPSTLARISRDGLEALGEQKPLFFDPSYISWPQPIEFPTTGGKTAHAFFYPPHNPDFSAPAGELPPLIVQSHGGPTSATRAVLSDSIQFWTSRGFGLVDVNYGGSTGYGREYRERLKGNWGIVDVQDCAAAALYLAESGRADLERLAIHGGSAGGYTALCALAFTDVFSAAASYFGVADAGALARETHKFESRYLDGLIGPWPEARQLYEDRSPLMHLQHFDVPLILFQGLEDKVVPPSQAEAMASALDQKAVPYAYIAYEGEQHGFRQAENLRRTGEAELYFYGRVFGFEPADELEPVEIHHADQL